LDINQKRDEKKELQRGRFLVFIVLGITVLVSTLLLVGSYLIHPYIGIFVETIMTYQILATKCLRVESMKVYKCLKSEGLEASRRAVSMIVGRDTSVLDEEGVAKAAIETVAENTSDGVIAPMLYTALGGPVLGWIYKAINTMDSMVGYKNDKYLYFGRTAAKLDDVVNYIPSRISAYLMILASVIAGKSFDGKRAYQIYKRDNRKHASPNSAQTESVCAGALGIQLAGDASYFGKIVQKPYIGDDVRLVEFEDIKRVNHLMYCTAWISELICLAVMVIITIL
ncbi:MAG: cobalamin biosynthesis protein CobD, partial [Lachnospiraceae bacterium]|nr:cobalamin biosynthesis protein CobD [Lachnospiraceae bacterium]